MKMKKIISMLLSLVTAVGFAACSQGETESGNENGNGIGGVTMNQDFKAYDLKSIAYQKTGLIQKTKSSEVGLTMYPIPEYMTGDEVSVNVFVKNRFSNDKPYFYALVDWGDGTWSYNGPYKNDANDQSTATLTHAYKSSGTYSIKACAINLSDGKLYGWSEAQTCTVMGAYKDGTLIDRLSPFASSVSSGSLENIFDGDVDTYVKTKDASDSDQQEYVGMLFDDYYKLDSLEIQFPTGQEYFPSNLAVEYTTDGGKTWYSLPKYYYLYDYSMGRYQPLMRFPDPTGATLSLGMDGIVANGVRISAKLFLMEGRTLAISEMRAYGDKELLFYTSNGGTYDADLNNMWTIFGTAESEPIVVGTVYSGKTNASPFRTGAAIILSTEWAEWSGLKFNWTDSEDAKAAYLNQLVNVRYGPDGWSGEDGYIYATADSPKHLGEQNHYSLNPIFIMAVRNYLLQGNDTVVTESQGTVPFMQAQNRYGQTMRQKVDKAMEYMLETLDGKSGIMTIYDPENDGTHQGNASNYWDTHRAYGYKSAYENALFYGSLVAMADIEAYYGNTANAEYYTQLAEKAKEMYNKLFWDDVKGRYICSINAKGERIDFGMTVVNFYAAAYGLANEEKAQLIYDWIDGKRIINGDTSQGADIYGEFVYSARTNTLDVSSTGEPYYWWDHGGALPCTPGTFGGFGHQMQNGGTIFYTEYYDMMGRIKTLGADSANSRFSVIMEEFHKDSLRRNRYMSFVQDGYQGIGEYSEGVLGEFPESGLVPLTYVTGFLGLNPSAQGLKISPNLPTEYSFAGVREYRFGNRTYSIQINRNLSSAKVQYDGEKYFVQLPADKEYVITYDNRLVEVNA